MEKYLSQAIVPHLYACKSATGFEHVLRKCIKIIKLYAITVVNVLALLYHNYDPSRSRTFKNRAV